MSVPVIESRSLDTIKYIWSTFQVTFNFTNIIGKTVQVSLIQVDEIQLMNENFEANNLRPIASHCKRFPVMIPTV